MNRNQTFILDSLTCEGFQVEGKGLLSAGEAGITLIPGITRGFTFSNLVYEWSLDHYA
jgi:hypothetical protein